MATLDNPITRQEMYLSYLNGNTGITLPEPITRIERYLYALCMSGGGGGGGQGDSNYNNLLNLPSIEGITLKGNTTLEDLGIQPDGETIVQELDGKIRAVGDSKIDSIKVNGEFLPIEDKSVDITKETLAKAISLDDLNKKIGDINNLDTANKTSLVDAINELCGKTVEVFENPFNIISNTCITSSNYDTSLEMGILSFGNLTKLALLSITFTSNDSNTLSVNTSGTSRLTFDINDSKFINFFKSGIPLASFVSSSMYISQINKIIDGPYGFDIEEFTQISGGHNNYIKIVVLLATSTP